MDVHESLTANLQDLALLRGFLVETEEPLAE